MSKEGLSGVISRRALLDWLAIEIDLSSGQNSVLKADSWAFKQVKKEVESGRFDVDPGREHECTD